VARASRPGPLTGLAAGAALGAALFGLVLLLLGRPERSASPTPPPGFSRGAPDPRAPVRVLATLGGPGLRALLLPLREDGGDARAEEAVLDRDLFPEGPPRRWARLLLANPPGAGPATVSLAGGAIVLETAAGPRGNEDLAAVVAARAAELPGHRRLDLGVHRAADRAVTVAPGEFVRVLLAFPGDADLGKASAASLGDGVRLLPRESPVERIRTALHEGSLADLPEADRAEARPPERDGAGGPR